MAKKIEFKKVATGVGAAEPTVDVAELAAAMAAAPGEWFEITNITPYSDDGESIFRDVQAALERELRIGDRGSNRIEVRRPIGRWFTQVCYIESMVVPRER